MVMFQAIREKATGRLTEWREIDPELKPGNPASSVRDIPLSRKEKIIERRFLAVRAEPEQISELLSSPGHGCILNLGAPVDSYGPEWRLVSHSFTIARGDVGIISLVFERGQEEAT